VSRELKKFIRDFYKLREAAEILGLVRMQQYLEGAARQLGNDICAFKQHEWQPAAPPEPPKETK
jgi:hypothetical protein